MGDLMQTVLLGIAMLAATALALRFALPINGKVRPWITPRLEPYLVVVFVAAAAPGLGFILIGSMSILS